MGELESVSDLIGLCKNISLHGELLTLVELSKNHEDLKWKGGPRYEYDIECDGKRIEVKSCNVDNDWAKAQRKADDSFKSGFDKIYPEKFDYLVCVSFKNDFSDAKYYVFKPAEVRLFPKGKWSNFPDAYTLEVRNHKGKKNNVLTKILADSEDAWDKIE